jgi:hypothetical protein
MWSKKLIFKKILSFKNAKISNKNIMLNFETRAPKILTCLYLIAFNLFKAISTFVILKGIAFPAYEICTVLFVEYLFI